MIRKKTILYVSMLLFASCNLEFNKDKHAMNNEKLQNFIETRTQNINGKSGFWNFNYKNHQLWLITDESHNRMRIMTQIVRENEIGESTFQEMLKANFDRSLDVRYAINNGWVWTCFIHPLKELSEAQVLDAFDQIVKAKETFGSAYSSSDLQFSGGK